MRNDFYVDGVGSGTFFCRLLSSYTVGTSSLTRTRVQPAQGMRFTAISTRYGLLSIKLPVRVFGLSPTDAKQNESKLKAALMADPVELYLPDGFYYTASLDSASESKEVTVDGCLRELTFTLSGFCHDVLTAVSVASGSGFFVNGTAPEMECRLTATAGAAADTYTLGTAIFLDVSTGDKLVVDGLKKKVTRNGENDIGSCDIVNWPLLSPGTNVVSCPDALTVEYYPIWL